MGHDTKRLLFFFTSYIFIIYCFFHAQAQSMFPFFVVLNSFCLESSPPPPLTPEGFELNVKRGCLSSSHHTSHTHIYRTHTFLTHPHIPYTHTFLTHPNMPYTHQSHTHKNDKHTHPHTPPHTPTHTHTHTHCTSISFLVGDAIPVMQCVLSILARLGSWQKYFFHAV